jgi:c-di-GMP-binding flagellar brake protein YcgR
MTSWEGLNRRNFPRVKYPCLVTIWYEEEGNDKEIFLTHTENLGIGGAAVICHKRFKLFSPIDLEIDLLDMETHVRCKGKIVWLVQRKDPDVRRPVVYDIGVEFQDIKEEDARRISTIVQRLGRHQDNFA